MKLWPLFVASQPDWSSLVTASAKAGAQSGMRGVGEQRHDCRGLGVALDALCLGPVVQVTIVGAAEAAAGNHGGRQPIGDRDACNP